MGNNPISSVDPDGGACFDTDGNPITCPPDYEGFNNLVSVQYFDNGNPVSLANPTLETQIGTSQNQDLMFDELGVLTLPVAEGASIAGVAAFAAPLTSLIFLSGGGEPNYELTVSSGNAFSMTYSEVENISTRKNKTEYFLQYGKKEKMKKILQTGVIPTYPNTNQVYLTTSMLTPKEAFIELFMGLYTH